MAPDKARKLTKPGVGLAGIASVVLALGSAFVLPSAALATWQEPVSGARQVSDIGDTPSLASIGGVPYVAWQELHGANHEIFVARLNASGTAWEKVGGLVNFDPGREARNPSLTSVGGAPYVAWEERTANSNFEIRVARLNAAGTRWEEPWAGVDANHGGIDASTDAHTPRLATVGGVPYVAWDEGGFDVVRVARLAATTWVQPWVGVSASSGGIQDPHSSPNGGSPDIASINNTPYVAWSESGQLRVARLNPGNSTWEQPWSGVSATSGGISDPTNHVTIGLGPDELDGRPSLASINNFPYVAWLDRHANDDGDNARVARLDTSTFPAPTWKQEAMGVSATDGRINELSSDYASNVSLASVNAGPSGVGVPYLAWAEYEQLGPAGPVFELRVARFDRATHAWQEPWPDATKIFGAIGETETTSERRPSLVSVDGVPFLARYIYGGSSQTPTLGIRVSRLEPEYTSQSAAPSAGGGEAFTVTAHTYGIPFPIGFQYGPALESQTTAVPASAGSDTVTVTRQVGALRPATTYEYRPFATAGVPAPLVVGPTATFRTNASGTGVSTGASAVTLATVLRERISPSRFPAAPSGPSVRAAKRRTYGARVTFNLDRAGSVRFTVSHREPGRKGARGRCVKATRRNRKARRCTRVVTLRGGFTVRGKAGANTFRFTGRLNRKRLTPGRFRLGATPIAGRLKGRTMSASFRIVK